MDRDARQLSDPAHAAVVRGVLGIIGRDGRFLMIRRAAHLAVGGAWCFPGGHIHDDESDERALVREMREELGLEVAPGRLLTELIKRDGRLVLRCWSADIVGGSLSPAAEEVADVRWMSPDDMRRMPLTDATVPLDAPATLITGTLEILDRIGELD
ncbi:MAG: NUDIX domain-containing protein [Phycisphaerae bacterium]|nr:NUDIX domain-containing protein [Phycisphaerae bacterium]NUQ45552.1 NUDIX domain-containing protein [Phycisphaerae bacterium]